MATRKPPKPLWNLSTQQLREATAEFDGPALARGFARPSAVQRAAWNLAAGKRGRPRIGEGAKTISVTIERTLLSQADRRAKALKISRAQLIARGLQALIASKPRRAA